MHRKQYRRLPHVLKKEREYTKQWRKLNPEKARATARSGYQRNILKERARSRRYQKQHPEAVRAAIRRYRLRHPDRVFASQRRRRARFKTAIDQFKTARGCVDCGYKASPLALDFDHVKGMKRKCVSMCGSIASALKEAEKCEVRCANCHRIMTAKRRLASIDRPHESDRTTHVAVQVQ